MRRERSRLLGRKPEPAAALDGVGERCEGSGSCRRRSKRRCRRRRSRRPRRAGRAARRARYGTHLIRRLISLRVERPVGADDRAAAAAHAERRENALLRAAGRAACRRDARRACRASHRRCSNNASARRARRRSTGRRRGTAASRRASRRHGRADAGPGSCCRAAAGCREQVAHPVVQANRPSAANWCSKAAVIDFADRADLEQRIGRDRRARVGIGEAEVEHRARSRRAWSARASSRAGRNSCDALRHRRGSPRSRRQGRRAPAQTRAALKLDCQATALSAPPVNPRLLRCIKQSPPRPDQGRGGRVKRSAQALQVGAVAGHGDLDRDAVAFRRPHSRSARHRLAGSAPRPGRRSPLPGGTFADLSSDSQST